MFEYKENRYYRATRYGYLHAAAFISSTSYFIALSTVYKAVYIIKRNYTIAVLGVSVAQLSCLYCNTFAVKKLIESRSRDI